MPWQTPTLVQVRSLVRDAIHGRLPGSDATIPNSVLRVTSDVQGAACFLTLEYIDWLALQLLPDTAETEWLDRHGNIWLTNADGTTGRKIATLAIGSATFTGQPNGTVIPLGTQLNYSAGATYETLAEITATDIPSPAPIRALQPGSFGNLVPGTQLALATSIVGADASATVVSLDGGTDTETDDELRMRVLLRIRQPPMGGAAEDYVNWALRVPGVTRAWVSPLEMGIGTVTVRFMMDNLRADQQGFPLPGDIDTVYNYINTVRPVAVKDFFVVAPIPLPVDMTITFLNADNPATRGAITSSLLSLFVERSIPGQTWYRAWTDQGISAAPGVISYDLLAADVVPSAPGYMPVLGDIRYG